jgi:hypothetical protein
MQISRAPGSVEEAHNFLVADYRGQISFATSGIAKILGYSPRDMLRLNISALVEAPFSYMHAKWLAVRRPHACRICNNTALLHSMEIRSGVRQCMLWDPCGFLPLAVYRKVCGHSFETALAA